VKPIHLNLASRPYRDYRPVYAVVVVMSLLTAFLMLNNIETYYRYKHETRATRAKIAQLEVQAQQEKQHEDIATRKLQSLDLTMLNAQTRFVNAKLSERAFSWSALLDELESVVAEDVRLISVAPSFAERGVDLALQFESKSSRGLIETLNRMHADPQFDAPFPSNETHNEFGYAFQITVKYLPPALKAAPAATPARSAR
jgi:hypothetical protein